MAKKIIPLQDRIVVRRAPATSTTDGGIHIPEAAQDKMTRGTVVAVGPGAIVDGKLVEPRVRVGAVVVFERFAGNEIKGDVGDDMLIMSESDILAELA